MHLLMTLKKGARSREIMGVGMMVPTIMRHSNPFNRLADVPQVSAGSVNTTAPILNVKCAMDLIAATMETMHQWGMRTKAFAYMQKLSEHADEFGQALQTDNIATIAACFRSGSGSDRAGTGASPRPTSNNGRRSNSNGTMADCAG